MSLLMELRACVGELPFQPAEHVGDHPSAVRRTLLEELVVELVVPAHGASARRQGIEEGLRSSWVCLALVTAR